MEVLQGIFPSIPSAVLCEILERFENNVEGCSNWLLENDWTLFFPNERAGEGQNSVINISAGNNDNASFNEDNDTIEEEEEDEFDDSEDDEEIDDEDEDDDDDDDDEQNGGSNTDDELHDLSNAVPPQRGAQIVETSEEESVNHKEDSYWVCFDDQLVKRSLIEMLNIPLCKLAHGRIAVLNTKSHLIAKEDARVQLKSQIKHNADRTLDHDTGSSGNNKRKRVSSDSGYGNNIAGYWGYYFTIGDLDMTWRSILHAHLFNNRFGPIIEFFSASSIGSLGSCCFDTLMYIQNRQQSRRSNSSSSRNQLQTLMQCCLLFPYVCTSVPVSHLLYTNQHLKEMSKLGKNICTTLGLKHLPLYFRCYQTRKKVRNLPKEDEALDLPPPPAQKFHILCSNNNNNNAIKQKTAEINNHTLVEKENEGRNDFLDENGSLTKEYFEKWSTFRIKRIEIDGKFADGSINSSQNCEYQSLKYQPQKKIEYLLQTNIDYEWVSCKIDE